MCGVYEMNKEKAKELQKRLDEAIANDKSHIKKLSDSK